MTWQTMYKGLVNSPETTITNNISESDTIIYVLDPARAPELPNLMTLGTGTNAETVLVTAINDNALTVQRGFQGIAKAWPAGTVIARNFTEYDYAAFKANIEDLDTRVGPLANLLTTIKTSVVNAINSLKGEFTAHLADTAPHSGATPEFNGVKFPATQVASADANTLDDYEEGTWTPLINRHSTRSEVTYTANEGKYTKIGRIVFIHGYVNISAVITDGNGLNYVEGLPFTPATTYRDVGSVFFNDIFSTSTAMSVMAHGGENRLYFKDATRVYALMSENWIAGQIIFSLAYLV